MRRIVQWIGLALLVAGTANAQGWTAVSPEGGRCKVDMPAGNSLRGEKKLTLGRAQGREFTLAQANGTTTAVRLYWARNRLYQLGVTGRAGVENQPETRHFFESFALVRP